MWLKIFLLLFKIKKNIFIINVNVYIKEYFKN
jgi:hypothetical protein